MKHIISYVLALVAVALTAADASAQDYDFTTDDGLYLKITATSTDTIEVSLVGIKLSQEDADMTVNRVITYRNNPIIITDISLTLAVDSPVGNTLTIQSGINISSLKYAPFRNYNLPKDKTMMGIIAGNMHIQSVTLPYGITSIVYRAFAGCSSLASISLPSSVTEIGERSFSGCEQLKSISLSGSVTEIADDAFNGCTKLSKVEGLEKVTSVGDRAFKGCSSLQSLQFSAALNDLGSNAFSGCTNLTDINIGSVRTIKAYTFSNTGIKSLDFLAEVTDIKSYGLLNMDSLEDAALPNSVSYYPNQMISGKNIKRLRPGDKIKILHQYEFCGKESEFHGVGLAPILESIDLNRVEELQEWALYSFSGHLTSISLPSSVKSAYTTSFYSCYNVTVEDGVEPLFFASGSYGSGHSGDIYLGRSLVGDCYLTYGQNRSPFGSIKSLILGDLVEHLPGRTFQSYDAKDLVLPKNLRFIGQNCFRSISNEELVLPARMDTIGANAFGETPNLQKVISYAQVPPVCDPAAFSSMIYAFARLEVPDVDAYRAAPGWKNFRNIVTSGIDDPLADPSAPVISVEEGAIKVSGTGPAEIYSADGRLIYRGSPAAIPALPRGLYIVRAGTTSLKLTL